MPEFSNNNTYQGGGADRTSEFDAQDIEQNKGISALAYLGILFFLPLVACPGSKFGKFHANQGLLLFIVMITGNIAGSIISAVFHIIPFIGGLVGTLIHSAIGIVILIFLIVGLVNTLNGRAKELPVIGGIELLK